MLFKDYNQTISHFKELFTNNASIKFRSFTSFDNKINACIIYSEGMIIHETIYKTIIHPIQNLSLNRIKSTNNLQSYICNTILSSEEVRFSTDTPQIVKSIYSGDTLLLIEHCDHALIINTRGWETRAIEEPKSERTTKGSQEGFTEAAIVNISLLKRRIQNASLMFKLQSIGSITQTDVYMSYVEGIVSEDLINEVSERLSHISLDAILDSNHISESISDYSFSLFDTIGNSQKPDTIAAKLLEGKIAIIVNGCPDVLYVPFLFYEHFLCSEDYYYNYLFSLFNRCIRILAFLISSSISALYLALVTFHQQILPQQVFINVASAREGVPFLTIIELIIMLLTFEILREAGARLSLNIGQAVSIVGAIVLGEAAVSARLISAPIVIIAALSGITSLMFPKAANGLVYIRFFLLLLVSFFGLYGYTFGVMMIIAYLSSLESFGINFMSFINTFPNRQSKDTLFRIPFFFHKNNGTNITKNLKKESKNNE